MDFRLYAIISISEVNKIDFKQVKETSFFTTRKSIDGLLTFIEFDCYDIVEFLQNIDVLKIVNYNELNIILQTKEWNNYL